MRRLVLAVAVVIATTVAAVTAGTAQAFEPPLVNQPYNQTQYDQQVADLIKRTIAGTPDPAIPPDLDAPKARRGLWRMRAAARVLPALRLMGPVGLALGAAQAYVGYKVTIGSTVNYFRFGTFSGSGGAFPSGPTYRDIYPVQWRYFPIVTPAGVSSEWQQIYSRTTISGGVASERDTFDGACVGGPPSYCTEGSTAADEANFDAALATSGATKILYQNVVNQSASWPQYMYSTSDATLTGKMPLHDACMSCVGEPQWWTDLPAGGRKVTAPAYARPANAGDTAADLTAARAELDADPDRDTRDYINRYLDPSYDPEGTGNPAPSETFTLPAPEPNESTTAYLNRLQTLGYVGTATTVTETTTLEGYGPNAPTRITAPGSSPGTTQTLDPVGWPNPGPTIRKDSDVTVRQNPSSATPVATAPPATPGIDFSPITDLEGGCSFPFGLICWAQDVTEWFNVAPDAPSFTFPIPSVEAMGTTYGGGGSFTVDLNIMDAYMAIIRSLISVALWVGAVYFLASRLLGFTAGGDPAAAADEALDY